MSEYFDYDNAVEMIKTAILQSQYDAARSVNEKQLMLYYSIGKYISRNSRNGYWGKGAIDTISRRLDREMPGLRGFSARSLRDMRKFYEEWSCMEAAGQEAIDRPDDILAPTGAKIEIVMRWPERLTEMTIIIREGCRTILYRHSAQDNRHCVQSVFLKMSICLIILMWRNWMSVTVQKLMNGWWKMQSSIT